MSSLLFHSLSLRSSIGSVGKRFGGGKRFMAIVPFKLSDIGEGIAEVEVLKWHVKVGDRVSQFDKLLEVQSDKATVDITSRFDGVVTQLHYKIGDMARTGTALVDLEVKDSKAESLLPAAPDSSTAASALPDSAASKSAMNDARGLRSLATPAVRRIAREQGVSVSSVTGTGKAGRVTKDDMLRYSDNNASAGTGMGNAAGGATNISPRVSASKREDEVIPLRGLARAMAKSMTASWAIPHFGFADEVVVDELVAARTALSPLASSRGVKLTYLPFLVKAASLALLTAPNLNARVITGSDGDSLILRGSHNFGIAMDSPRGLIVPVIQDVAGLTVLEISEEIARLSALAKEGRLGESDLSGISFTLSNIGSVGGTYMSPVIPSGTVCIGAIGRVARVPRFASTLPRPPVGASADAILPANVLNVSWSADHRVVDGATLARFSAAWKSFVERPETMLGHLR